MAFYDDRIQKPRRKASPGPEDGYRPRGEKGRGRDGKKPAFGKPAPGKPGEGETPAGKPGFGKPGFGKPAYGKPAEGGPRYGRPAENRPGDRRPDRKPWDIYKDDGYTGNRRKDGRTAPPDRPARADHTERQDRQARPQRPDRLPMQDRRPDESPRPNGRGFDRERFRAAPRPAPIERPVPQTPAPPFDGEEPMPRENLLVGRNPIREAVKSGRDIEKLLVASGELSGSAREIVAMARERGVIVQVVDRQRLSAIAPNHQGMIAFASAYRYATVEDMLALAKEKGEDALLVILDGVTDPHNLGAIIRSADCAGAHGVIVPERRAVGLTPAAVKASAGAVEYLPVARVGNLVRTMESLKEQGLWIVAADMAGEPYAKAALTGPLAIVIGAEGEGVSRLALDRSDKRVALPVRGKIDSLNASVAAGVLLYEIRRQRG